MKVRSKLRTQIWINAWVRGCGIGGGVPCGLDGRGGQEMPFDGGSAIREIRQSGRHRSGLVNINPVVAS
jgi:hypothetical protein